MNLFNHSSKRARLLGTVLLLVTFVAGALAGAASERVMRADDPQPQPQRSSELRGGTRRLLLDEQFARELQLTTDQRAQIKAIMDRRDQQAKKVWSEAEPRLKAVGADTRVEIEKVLTPEQTEKLEAEIARRHAAWKDRHKCHDRDSAEVAKKSQGD
jgi:Spy/CpxP family protein refolding chaperone